MSEPLSVVVVGGGVAGLATGWLLSERARETGRPLELRVLEAGAVAGGHTRTDIAEGCVCERGANGFLDNEPATLELVRRLGLSDRLVRASERSTKRYVYHSGRMHLLPMAPGAFLRSSIVPFGAKLRMGLELFVPPRRDERDETVDAFARRRLGAGFARYLLDPMVSGIFAGDTRELSLAAVFPKMVELEREHGGLFRAMFAKARQKRRSGEGGGGPAGPGGTLHSFERGMGELTEKLATELGDRVVPGAEVQSLAQRDGGWQVSLVDGAVVADEVVLACPAHAAASIVASLAPEAAEALAAIRYAAVSVACDGYHSEQVARPLDGFGVLVPRTEGMRSLGSLCSDRIFEGQAPAGTLLLRTLVGGAHDPEAAELDAAALSRIVATDLDTLFGVQGAPAVRRIFRHRHAIAQYTVGHLDRVAATEQLEQQLAGLWFTGAAYRGVSINACVKDAFRLVDALWQRHAD